MVLLFTGTCVECAHKSKLDIMGPAEWEWKLPQGKELDIDWCQGNSLPAELTDIICDDPLQPQETEVDDIKLVNHCDSVQEEPRCEDKIQE